MADLFLRAAAVLVVLAVLGGIALLWVRAQAGQQRPSAMVVPIVTPGLEARRERRIPVRLLASWEGLDERLCTVDISRGGCCLRGAVLPVGEGTITLWMPGALPRWQRRATVAWSTTASGDPMCGVSFLDDGDTPADVWDDFFREHPPRTAATGARRIVVAVADPRAATAAVVNEAIEAGRHASALGELHERLGASMHAGNTLEVRNLLRRTLALLEAQAATTMDVHFVDAAADFGDAEVVLCDAADVATIERLMRARGSAERPLLAGVGPEGATRAGDLLLREDRDVRELLATVRTLLARTPAYGAREASAAIGVPSTGGA